MATYYGVNATLRDQTVPSGKVGVGEERGRVRLAYDEWAVPTAVIAAPSTVDLFEIPKGARVIEAFCMFPDQGTTGAGKLGWLVSEESGESADDDGLIASIDFATAAGNVKGGTAAGMGKKFTQKVRAQLTITTAFDVGTGTIKAGAMYVLD